MIKINLALRKQAVVVDLKEKSGGPNLSALKSLNAEALLSFFKQQQARNLILAVIVAVMGSFLLNGYEQEQLDALGLQFDKATAENMKAKAELAKTAGFEQLKKQFDEDEALIKTKLQTIQKLIADRQTPPKFLMALSGEIPKQVWLSEFDKNEKGEVVIKGNSLGFDQITDFMKALGDNEYLSGVRLQTSEQAKGPQGSTVATFELHAQRK